MSYKTALLSAAALGISVPVFAQVSELEENRLGPVIVEGSRLDQSAAEVGSSVSIISEEDLEKLDYDYIFQNDK